MKTIYIIFVLIAANLCVLSISSQKAGSTELSSRHEACLDEDRSETDEGWPLLEITIPACKRAIVSFDRGTKLDLGMKHITKIYTNGMTAIRGKVLRGQGSYDADGKVHDLTGINLWIALDRCELAKAVLTDEQGRKVSLKSARFLETTQELSAIANGDEIRNYKNDCRP